AVAGRSPQRGRLAAHVCDGRAGDGAIAGMSVVARRRTNAVELLAVLGAALALRVVVSGAAGAASEPGAALFAVLLLAAVARTGWRPGRLVPGGLVWGVIGAAGLVVGPMVLRLAGPPHPSL